MPDIQSVETIEDPEARKLWFEDRGMALWYVWGRIDMGEKRESDNHWEFAKKWADAKHSYRLGERGSLCTMQDALAKHDAGEAI